MGDKKKQKIIGLSNVPSKKLDKNKNNRVMTKVPSKKYEKKQKNPPWGEACPKKRKHCCLLFVRVAPQYLFAEVVWENKKKQKIIGLRNVPSKKLDKNKK